MPENSPDILSNFSLILLYIDGVELTEIKCCVLSISKLSRGCLSISELSRGCLSISELSRGCLSISELSHGCLSISELSLCFLEQIDTTKGTGGDLIVLEEAAYVDPGFFFETVAPLLCMEQTSLIGISTLTCDYNFYTRLTRLRDRLTGKPLFSVKQVQLACQTCIEAGKAASCVHKLHEVPRWQSQDRHEKLRLIMQDRPDLVESELAGLAFDSAQSVFKSKDLEIMFSQPPPPMIINEDIYVFIDPAAGGPSSDYAILSLTRYKGLITVG